MTQISTEYRGYTIRYNENSEEWSCYDIGHSSAKISAVKARIDKTFLDLRKASSIACFEISDYKERGSKTQSTITEFVNTKQDRSWSNKTPPPEYIVAVMAKRNGNERNSRREVNISSLMCDTPEAHAAFNRYSELRDAANVADEAAKKAFTTIPRITLDMVSELKRIHDTAKEEAKGE